MAEVKSKAKAGKKAVKEEKAPQIEKFEKDQVKKKKLVDQANGRKDMQIVSQDGDKVVTITTALQV